jgi:RNA polymerase sigma factor (sigma-70 family)
VEDIILNGNDRYKLLLKAKSGNKKAREQFIEENIALVVNIVNKSPMRGEYFQDMVQEGTIGLIRAFEKFDLNMGTEFSTYATYWIRQAVEDFELKNSTIIKKPSKYKTEISAIITYMKRYKNNLRIVERKTGIDKNRIRSLILLRKDCASLDNFFHVNEDQDIEILETNDDKDFSEDYIQNHMIAELRRTINNFMRSLTDIEKYILEHRFGLNGKEKWSLQKIGGELNLSAERIRQIEQSIINNLKTQEILKEYMEIIEEE